MPSILDDLDHLNLTVKNNAALSDYTTFRLGGPCPSLISCQTAVQLEAVVLRLIKSKEPFILIGSGSNLVVSDEGLSCTVVRYVSPTPFVQKDGTDLIVSGSTLLDDLAKVALDFSLEGINYASGIPGTIGGAIVGNAGAFGKQVGDYLKSVCVITKTGIKKEVDLSYLGFSYRHSKLKETGDIVLWARFGFKDGNKTELARERGEILKIRHEKHPDLETQPCAGSFFRNVEPTSKAERRQATGFFLEEAGGKDLHVGGAVIFDKHANIIIKSNGCTAQNVHDLSLKMAALVKDKFGIELVREVRFVGQFLGKPYEAREIIW